MPFNEDGGPTEWYRHVLMDGSEEKWLLGRDGTGCRFIQSTIERPSGDKRFFLLVEGDGDPYYAEVPQSAILLTHKLQMLRQNLESICTFPTGLHMHRGTIVHAYRAIGSLETMLGRLRVRVGECADPLEDDPRACPVCGQRAVVSCKCPRIDCKCQNGHEWHTCTIHHVKVEGQSDHGPPRRHPPPPCCYRRRPGNATHP